MLFRPSRVNEAWWAAAGAVALVVTRALPVPAAWASFARGFNVYLFLIGMMALAEFARAEGVFDWIAGSAVRVAGGSRGRLLLLVYAAGIVTTALLSNDATIIVLTPAVLVAVGRTDARVEPYVFACALVANAASTALPIANPSNLLFFAAEMPPLSTWLAAFGWASVASIAATFVALRLVFARDLSAALRDRDDVYDDDVEPPRPLALVVLGVSALVLIVTSSFSGSLGITAFALGIAAALVATHDRSRRVRHDRAGDRLADRRAHRGPLRAGRRSRRRRRDRVPAHALRLGATMRSRRWARSGSLPRPRSHRTSSTTCRSGSSSANTRPRAHPPRP